MRGDLQGASAGAGPEREEAGEIVLEDGMSERFGWMFRVKNPIKTRQYKFGLASTVDVALEPGQLGLFWDRKAEVMYKDYWTVTMWAHPESQACGVVEIPSLDDIEFLRKDEYLPEYGKPPENLP